MNAPITKSLLRKSLLHYRKMLEPDVFEKRNTLLLKNLQKLITEKNPKVIHTFLPIKRNNEVDVTSLFMEWRDVERAIVVSKTNFSTREMTHYFLKENTILKENTLGIPEPEAAEEASFARVDLILVPLLVADKMHNRIGYGGGFYDRLLNETKAIKVGLSLSPPLDQIVQKEDWDIPLDHIISYK